MLWAKFMESSTYQLNTLMQSFRDTPTDMAKKQMFINDIQKLENETGCQIMRASLK